MRIEHEWRDDKGQDREPEVDQMRNPDRHGGIEQEEKVAHAHIDTRSGKSGIKDGERHASSRKSTPSGDISCPTEGQIAQNGLGVDLSREHLEDRRQ